MTQPSLFSADLIDPEISDLGGLLAAHGQSAVVAAGARLSMLLALPGRGQALVGECAARGVAAELLDADAPGRARGVAAELLDADAPGRAGDGESDDDHGSSSGSRAEGRAAWLLRTERTSELAELAAAWTRGAVKAVPDGLVIGAGMLRLWVLAAGGPTAGGYLLGLDPHAPDTYHPLAGALARTGLAAAVIGATSPAPALRITGRKRLARLAELVGSAPAGPTGQLWPDPGR